MLGFGIFRDTEARAFHLSFALFLACACYPAFKSSPRDRVPLFDLALAGAAIACVLYLVVFYRELILCPGLPTFADVVVSVVGVALLIEASRRAEDPWMPVISITMLVYVFAGPYLGGLLARKGALLNRAASQFWLTSEGVFGVALGVSTSFIFLFVLFGALLDRAGDFFIQVAVSLLGRFRGAGEGRRRLLRHDRHDPGLPRARLAQRGCLGWQAAYWLPHYDAHLHHGDFGSQPGVVTRFAARLLIPHRLTVEERTRNRASGIHSPFPVNCSVYNR